VLASVHASETPALSGLLNRNPFRLWLTLREENKTAVSVLPLDCAVVSVVFLITAAAARQFYAFFAAIRGDADSFFFRNLIPR
jgi:hypothetical protein